MEVNGHFLPQLNSGSESRSGRGASCAAWVGLAGAVSARQKPVRELLWEAQYVHRRKKLHHEEEA